MFVLALTGSVRFIGRAPGVLIGVLRGLLWSSPKAGAEGLPFGIVRALDPCSCSPFEVISHDNRVDIGLSGLAKSYVAALSALMQHLQERKAQAVEAEDYEEASGAKKLLVRLSQAKTALEVDFSSEVQATRLATLMSMTTTLCENSDAAVEMVTLIMDISQECLGKSFLRNELAQKRSRFD